MWLVGRQKGHPACKKSEWWGTGVWSKVQMICIWPSWCHCHSIVSCFIKIQHGFTCLVPAYSGCPGKRLLNGCSSSSSLLKSGAVHCTKWTSSAVGFCCFYDIQYCAAEWLIVNIFSQNWNLHGYIWDFSLVLFSIHTVLTCLVTCASSRVFGNWPLIHLFISMPYVCVYCLPGGWFVFVIFLSLSQPRFTFCDCFSWFSVLAKRLAGKSVSKMTCFVLSAMLNLNSVSQPHV